MKNIILMTSKNHIFINEFANNEYMIKELYPPFFQEEIYKLKHNLSGGYAIVEVYNDNLEGLRNPIEVFAEWPIPIICLVNEITKEIRAFLIEYGIPDVIFSYDAKRVINYINAIDRNINSLYGKILILDDLSSRINIIKTIVTRFNYVPVVTQTIDELFENFSETDIQLILVNLGTEDLDINGFIRKAFLRSDIKSVPIIPYKSTIEEFFIHEIISGLNRLTNVILSSDEVFSFLVDILFRKELFPYISMLKEYVRYDKLIQFSKDSLKSIYYSLGHEIFSIENILKENSLMKFKDVMNSMHETIIKVDGLRWLINNNNS